LSSFRNEEDLTQRAQREEKLEERVLLLPLLCICAAVPLPDWVICGIVETGDGHENGAKNYYKFQ
jgi:hypothetical protein